jgi:hypothetical protein
MDFELLDSAIRKEIGRLARSAAPEEESWRRLRGLFLSMADALRLQVGETRPPVRLDRMKEMRRIKSEILFGSPDGPDAMLSPSSEGFTLRLKVGQSAVRHRFSTAHEIGHTFFYDISKTPPRRLLTAGLSARFRGNKASLEDKEEDICSVFAGALLLPQHLLLGELKAMPEDKVFLLLRMARKYAVSLEVVVRRLLIDLSEMRNTLVIFRSVRKHDDGYDVRSIRGKQLASYTRVREVALIGKAIDILEKEKDPCDRLNEVAVMAAGDVNMSSRGWNNGQQIVVVLCFREDAGSALGLNPHHT